MDTKVIAEAMCRKYETRNPFDLAASLSIIVLHEPLGEIMGYYNRRYRQKFIHINEELDGYAATFTCAHEVAHAILHPNLSTPFLRAHTRFSVGKFESEADRFALNFLYDDNELLPFLDRAVSDAASYMGVPLRLAEYRMGKIKNKNRTEGA